MTSPRLVAEIDSRATDKQIEEIQDFVNTMNYLIDEGFIEMEIDDDGEPRFYRKD